VSSKQQTLGARLTGILPVGRGLSSELWERRHRGILILLWLHVPVLFVYGLTTHHSLFHTLIDLAPVVVAGVGSGEKRLSKLVRSAIATFGLVACSALLVHLSGGLIEMHFHFFVVIGVITLYQSWVPFLLAIVFVVLHHGVVGVLHPEAVYNHPEVVAIRGCGRGFTGPSF
jgi:hypothetical protein